MSKQEVGLLPGYVLVQVRCFRAARLPAGGLRPSPLRDKRRRLLLLYRVEAFKAKGRNVEEC